MQNLNVQQLSIGIALGFIPVCAFLLSLVYLDSYKLVRFRMILRLVGAGGIAAILSYFANSLVLGRADADLRVLTVFVTPLVEELLKSLPLLLLLRAKRIGFLVDAAIFGFAIGSGFALIENCYYLWALPDASPRLWAVRGFGTGIMHGGSTAILAMTAKSFAGKASGPRRWMAVLGVLFAYLIHALFNSFLLPPTQSALAVILLFPPLVFIVFAQSEKALQSWLGSGFDVDAELIASINSGEFSSSPPGLYLQSLREHFGGPVLADMLCFLRLHAELALRAKGLLMMRESGFEVKRDAELGEKLEELRYLRKSMGKTGELAIAPVVHSSAEDIWQLQLLDAQ